MWFVLCMFLQLVSERYVLDWVFYSFADSYTDISYDTKWSIKESRQSRVLAQSTSSFWAQVSFHKRWFRNLDGQDGCQSQDRV